MRGILLALLALIILISGCSGGKKNEAPTKVEIMLNTSDGQSISANHYINGSKKTGVILIHMLSKDKGAWDKYAPELQAAGYDVVAIDLRGHGKSSGEYELFTISDYQRMPFDVKAAADYLAEKGDPRIFIVGASIGANIGLKYATTFGTGKVEKLVMLSPGLEYRWIVIEEDAPKYRGDSLIIASRDDEYSAKSSSRLKDVIGGNVTYWEIEGPAHGTDILPRTSLWGTIVGWLDG